MRKSIAGYQNCPFGKHVFLPARLFTISAQSRIASTNEVQTMKNKKNNRSWKTSLKTSMLAGTLILLTGCPVFAQDSVPNPVTMQSNVLQTLGNFMQNLEQQLSSLNQMATPSSQVQMLEPLYSTPSAPARRSASPAKVAPKLPSHAPLPAVSPNPLVDEEEVSVQQNVDQNISALQSTFNTENSLQAQIGKLSQKKSASNVSKIATLTKQLKNEKAFEKQVRSNVDGWNKYLISYEQYLTRTRNLQIQLQTAAVAVSVTTVLAAAPTTVENLHLQLILLCRHF